MHRNGKSESPARASRRGESSPPVGASPVDVLLGAHVRALRVRCGLSQTALGDRIGLSFQQIQKYERGANRISASTLVAIGTCLGVSAAEILKSCGAEQDMAPNPALAVDPLESELLGAFRAIASSAKREAVFNLVLEIGRSEAKSGLPSKSDGP